MTPGPSRRALRLQKPAGPPLTPGAVVALGNFDGVHRGHAALLGAAAEAARGWNAGLAAAVFEPHPRTLFQPEGAPFRLQSAAQRARALMGLGVEAVVEMQFDPAFAALDADAFSREVIAQRLGAAAIAVGADFCYGRGRTGDVASLHRQGAAYGFAVIVIDAVRETGAATEKVSSSAIRAALREGDVARANALMGRPFAIEGVVEEGAKRGRTIDFPTANVSLGAYVRPAFGVYAVRVDLGDGRLWPGVANIGVKPTVSEEPRPLLEVHLFDFAGDLYGRMIETQVHAHLRAERRFESFAALRDQIAADAAAARALIGAL